MEYEWQTYGFAGIALPDGGTKFVYFRGTQEEAQRQVDAAAKECGRTAPKLCPICQTLNSGWRERMRRDMAGRLFNVAPDCDQAKTKQP